MSSGAGASDGRAAELTRGWAILTACMLGLAVGVHSLPFYTSGLFMNALQEEFGWSRAQISAGPTVLIAALGVASPVIGTLTDRWGERALILPCLAILASFFVVLSHLGPQVELYYAVVVCMAVFASGSATPTFTRIITANFDKARGTALGIALIGTGLASTFVPPALGQIIHRYGWRAGYLALAVLVSAAVPIILLLLRKDRRTSERARDGNSTAISLRQMLADGTFWLLALSLFLVASASPGLIVHFVPLLADQGVEPAHAAALASAVGVCLIAGRLLTGIAVDHLFAPRVAATIMLISAAGFAVLAFGGSSFAIAGAIGIGLSFGAELDLIGYLTSRYFGLQSYGRVFGILYAIVLAGSALSPLVYGLVVDRTGTYRPALIGACAALLASALLFLFMRPFDARPR